MSSQHDQIELLDTAVQTSISSRASVCIALRVAVRKLMALDQDGNDELLATSLTARALSCLECVEYFFNNIEQYSTEKQPSYLTIELFKYMPVSSNSFANLEEFWSFLVSGASQRSKRNYTLCVISF